MFGAVHFSRDYLSISIFAGPLSGELEACHLLGKAGVQQRGRKLLSQKV